jgi:hypothetical protein
MLSATRMLAMRLLSICDLGFAAAFIAIAD